MKLQLTPERAYRELTSITHGRFEKALPNFWKVISQSQVKAQTVLWLFCWAKTGMNSERTAQEIRIAFNQIFDHQYEWLDEHISHEYARKERYATGDIEEDFANLLLSH